MITDLTREEVDARIIVTTVKHLNRSIVKVKKMWVNQGKTIPALTDDQCYKLSTEHIYSMGTIRSWFPKPGGPKGHDKS